MDKKIAIKVITHKGKLINRYVDNITDYIDGNGPFKERPKKEDKVEAVNTTVAGGKGIAVTPITVAPCRTGAGLDPNMQLSKHLKLKDLLTPSSLCGNPAKIIKK